MDNILQLEVKVLIVDDNEELAKINALFLSYHGFSVMVCTNGQECMKCVQTSKPDIIMMDIDMPGQSGYEICRLIRAQDFGENLPVIAYTGRNLHAFRSDPASALFDDYLIKSTSLDQIIDVLLMHLKLFRNREL
ncbi:MAG TPA: response regulator [Dyadobacter sp.]|nr:response regulator [Dyadobacter sp.]